MFLDTLDKADYSWRPDRWSTIGGSKEKENHILGFKTDPGVLVLSISSQIESVLNSAEESVTDIKLKLKSGRNYNWSVDKSEVLPFDKR